jgi:hypothetical protein
LPLCSQAFEETFPLDDSHDPDSASGKPIDDAIIPDDQLTQRVFSELRHDSSEARLSPEAFNG